MDKVVDFRLIDRINLYFVLWILETAQNGHAEREKRHNFHQRISFRLWILSRCSGFVSRQACRVNRAHPFHAPKPERFTQCSTTSPQVMYDEEIKLSAVLRNQNTIIALPAYPRLRNKHVNVIKQQSESMTFPRPNWPTLVHDHPKHFVTEIFIASRKIENVELKVQPFQKGWAGVFLSRSKMIWLY